MDNNIDSQSENMFSVFKGYNQEQFDTNYNKVMKSSGGWRKYLKKCLPTDVMDCVMTAVPAVKFLKTYKFKSYIVKDIISGLSVGFMAIPQSFGYARIANVPEIVGLYTSLFPVIIYFLFTSSRHVSMGTMALTSLIIGSVISTLKLPSQQFQNHVLNTSDMIYNETTASAENLELIRTLKEQDDEFKILLAVSLSSAAGLMLLVMGLLKMGFIISFMSDAFISGFLSAATLRVVILEIKDVLGIHPQQKHVGFCEFFFNTYEIARAVRESNLVQVVMSIIAIVILVLVKEFVNKRFKEKLKIPIPIEIIVVMIFILVTRFAGLEANFNVEISASGIKSGPPSLTLPSLGLMYDHVYSSFLIAIMSFTLVGMMAKLFAQNHGYDIDNNQEMLAVGISGVVGSFFGSMIASTSPSRCMLMESSGGKTQLSHLFTALFALLTMVAFASFLRDLPICILASIIIVACIPLFAHFLKFYTCWLSSKYDFSVWCITFVTVLVFSVQTGLLVGVLYSLIMIHVWMKNESHGSVLERNSDGLFLDKDLYPVKSIPINETDLQEGSVLIFRFDSSLYFATVENFKELLFSKVPSHITLKKSKTVEGKLKSHKQCVIFPCKEKRKEDDCEDKAIGTNDVSIQNVDEQCVGDTDKNLDADKHSRVLLEGFCDVNNGPVPRRIVIDFSAVSFCDMAGAETLADLNSKYSAVGVDLCLASCNENVKNQLDRVKSCQNLIKNFLYPSVADAYLACVKKYTTAEHSIYI